jgi:RNA polymerase primary sigma factor
MSSSLNETWQASYLRRVCVEPLLTRQEEQTLARKVQAGDEKSRQRMIKANLRLVVKIAGGYVRAGVEPGDLVSEGTRGLVTAVSKYRPDVGAKFSTYASFWIHQAIRRHLDAFSMPWRISSSAKERISKLMKIWNQASEIKGRDPTVEELADEIGMDAEEIRALMTMSTRPVSLEQELREGLRVMDTIPAEGANAAEEAATHGETLTMVSKILGELPARERAIVEDRFGIGGRTPLTLEDIGLKHGLTRERIRQIEAKALRRLRKATARLQSGAL